MEELLKLISQSQIPPQIVETPQQQEQPQIVEISGSSSESSDPCPKGSTRNPVTYRCRKNCRHGYGRDNNGKCTKPTTANAKSRKLGRAGYRIGHRFQFHKKAYRMTHRNRKFYAERLNGSHQNGSKFPKNVVINSPTYNIYLFLNQKSHLERENEKLKKKRDELLKIQNGDKIIADYHSLPTDLSSPQIQQRLAQTTYLVPSNANQNSSNKSGLKSVLNQTNWAEKDPQKGKQVTFAAPQKGKQVKLSSIPSIPSDRQSTAPSLSSRYKTTSNLKVPTSNLKKPTTSTGRETTRTITNNNNDVEEVVNKLFSEDIIMEILFNKYFTFDDFKKKNEEEQKNINITFHYFLRDKYCTQRTEACFYKNRENFVHHLQTLAYAFHKENEDLIRFYRTPPTSPSLINPSSYGSYLNFKRPYLFLEILFQSSSTITFKIVKEIIEKHNENESMKYVNEILFRFFNQEGNSTNAANWYSFVYYRFMPSRKAFALEYVNNKHFPLYFVNYLTSINFPSFTDILTFSIRNITIG